MDEQKEKAVTVNNDFKTHEEFDVLKKQWLTIPGTTREVQELNTKAVMQILEILRRVKYGDALGILDYVKIVVECDPSVLNPVVFLKKPTTEDYR